MKLDTGICYRCLPCCWRCMIVNLRPILVQYFHEKTVTLIIFKFSSMKSVHYIYIYKTVNPGLDLNVV